MAAADPAASLAKLYRAAFPDEDLVPLVTALLALGADGGATSIVVEDADGPVAHAIVTRCAVEGSSARVALLGPVCVRPGKQRQGLGGKLVAKAKEAAAAGGAAALLVLGDPAWYGRFGFKAERDILPPYPVPDAWREAWQSLPLAETGRPGGRLIVPQPWRDPALWS